METESGAAQRIHKAVDYWAKYIVEQIRSVKMNQRPPMVRALTHTHTQIVTPAHSVCPLFVWSVGGGCFRQFKETGVCIQSSMGLLVFVLYHNIEWLSESGCSCVSVPFHMLDTAFDSLEKPCL